jgi:hypothetical protein
VVDGNVGLAPGGILSRGGTGHFALDALQHLLHGSESWQRAWRRPVGIFLIAV